MYRKSSLRLLVSALCLLFVVAACAQQSPATNPQDAQQGSVNATVSGGDTAAINPPAQNEAEEDDTRFAGVSLHVLTHDGPQISEPLKRRAPEFEERTGAKMQVSTVPFGDLYQTIMDDFTNGTKQYDVVVFAPQWMVDYAAPGYIEDLTERVDADTAIEWDDIAPFFRDFSAMYNGRIYTIPLDGDFQMVYYRSDLLEEEGLGPPSTWDDYIAIAQHFHGKDLNGDGEADYGSCISKKPNDQAYHMVWSVASAFIQTQGTQQGAFFDVDTMEPLVDNDAFATMLNIFKETTTYGPPNELDLGLPETRTMFISGRCALSLDWGDIGTLAVDSEQSQVVDKVGAVILPGSTEVLDRATGKLVTCDKALCPYAIEGRNHAPYAAFGGWSGSINAAIDSDKKDAAYAFLSYMSQPSQSNTDVTIGITGFNPYRISQFTNREAWIDAGMSEEAASKYLGAIGISLSSPNVVLDLRIPQNQRYQEVVLDQTLADFLAGTITRDEAMQRIYDGWEEITEEVGRDAQQHAYRASLGIQ